jgi:hypothetical protein
MWCVLEQTGDSADRIRLGPTGPALHWRHLHQQGSAACIIFLQAFAGRGSMPLAALCCSPLSTCCPLPRQRRRGRAREPESQRQKQSQRNAGVGKKRCLALHCRRFRPCNTSPCQHSGCQKFAQGKPLRNGQRVVGARHLYGVCKRTIPI